MIDALKFLNEKARMCESVTIESCPLRRYVLNCCDCGDITNAEMAVLVVEEWSKSHPKQTNADKFHDEMYHRAFETDDDTMWQSGCWVRYRAIEQVQNNMPAVIESEE